MPSSEKAAALGALLDEKQKDAKCKVMVFCNTKIDCERQSQAPLYALWSGSLWLGSLWPGSLWLGSL